MFEFQDAGIPTLQRPADSAAHDRSGADLFSPPSRGPHTYPRQSGEQIDEVQVHP